MLVLSLLSPKDDMRFAMLSILKNTFKYSFSYIGCNVNGLMGIGMSLSSKTFVGVCSVRFR